MINTSPVILGNLAYDYIENIPWDSTPLFAFSPDTDKYLDAIRNVIEKVPARDKKISFTDDIWDFNAYYEGINSQNYRINFIGLPDSIRNYVKFYVLYSIMGRNKISTTSVRVSTFKSIITRLMTTPDSQITLLKTEDFIKIIDERNISAQRKHSMYISSFLVLSFVKNNYRLPLLIDLQYLKKRSIEESHLSKNNSSKLPDIPNELFNAILNTAVRVMHDKDAEYNRRSIACVIVMLCQLGLRIGDLLALRCSDRLTKKLPKSGYKVPYIHYRSQKPSKSHDKLMEFDIFCTSLCAEAMDILEELRKNNPLSQNNDYLFVPLSSSHTKDDLPASRLRFGRYYKQFLYEEMKDIALTAWEGIPVVNYRPCFAPRGCRRDAVQLSVPDTRQFRVHVCSSLYNNQNVNLEYIRRYMGHLTEYMMGYYVRPKDTYQESIPEAEKFLREIVGEEDLSLVGGTLPKELKNNIVKFISKNKLNVMTNTKAVIDAFGDKLIIRGKRGGLCIRTSTEYCGLNDKRSNALYCAYNICPNLFHLYYMAEVAYEDFKALQETYKSAIDHGHTLAAEKELHKLRDLCGKTLTPELDELEREIGRKGVAHIIEKHPSLLPIIENLENIRKEIGAWMIIK